MSFKILWMRSGWHVDDPWSSSDATSGDLHLGSQGFGDLHSHVLLPLHAVSGRLTCCCTVVLICDFFVSIYLMNSSHLPWSLLLSMDGSLTCWWTII